MTNNPPDKIIELTQIDFDFLVDQIRSAQGMCITLLQLQSGRNATREELEKSVEMSERFKSVMDSLRKAK